MVFELLVASALKLAHFKVILRLKVMKWHKRVKDQQWEEILDKVPEQT